MIVALLLSGFILYICDLLFSERLIAQQNPLSQTDRPHQLFADAPPPPSQPASAAPMPMAPPPPPPVSGIGMVSSAPPPPTSNTYPTSTG